MTFIIAAPLAGTRDAWLQAGETNGRQRAEKQIPEPAVR